MSLGKLLLNLGVNTGTFETDMGRAARVSAKRSKQIKDQMDLAMKAIATGAIAAAGSLGTLVKKTADTADGIQKMSNRLGVSTEFLSQYRHVAELSGTTLERVGDGVRKMSKSINDGNNGLSTATRAFNSLGISLTELNALNPEQQFELIADRISRVDDQSVKAGAAMDIFGRAGVDLLTVLNSGAEGIKGMREEADAFGLTMSQEAADSAADFNDSITRLDSKLTGMAETIGQGLIPIATEMINKFNSPGLETGNSLVEKLQTTMITLYGATQLVGDGFEVVGKALGLFAVKGVQAFELVGGYLDSFVQRVKLGAKIIQSAWSDEADQEASELGKQIADMEARLESLYDTFKNDDIGFTSDAQAIIQGTIDEIQNLKNVAASTGKGINKNLTKPLNAAGDASEGLAKGAESAKDSLSKLAKQAADEAEKSLDDYLSIVQSLETPLETLTREYDEQVAIIGRYLETVEENSAASKMAGEILEQLTERFIENEAALKDVLSPYRELIGLLDQESFAIGATRDELIALDAARLLEQQGITATNTTLQIYLGLLGQVIGKLEEIESKNGVFGNGIQTFGDLLKDAFKDGNNFFDSVKDGFKSMTRDAESFADGLSSIGDFANQIAGFWDSTAGQDDAGRVLDTVSQIASTGVLGPVAQAVAQVAGFIDQLTGGKLFGTSYQLQSTTRQIDIGAGGAGGFVETLETRQRSLFRGTARRRQQSDLESDTLSALDQLFENLNIAIQNSAIAVGGLAGDIITGSFVEEFDKDGNLVSQMATVLGRTYEESFEEFSQRLTAENILAGVGTIFNDVGRIAEQWRGDASTLLDGAQLLLQAGVDINSGSGLFDTLQQVTNVITDMQKPGESLVETYNRVQGSVLQLDEALSVIGLSFEMARENYVQFAADITDAAGGIQQAASLWQSYFETFYTEQELAANALANATQTRDSLLTGLGVSTDIEIGQFRELFESLLPELSAEAVVQWLRAADAIGVVVDLESELNEQREENASQLATLIGQINNEIENMGLSPFALELKEINNAFQANIRSARQLGASEQELALIQTYASRQIQQAIQALENDIAGALTDLYGTELDQINQQIALLEQQQTSIGDVAQASANRYEQELRAIQNIQQFVDDLFLNEQLSPLNPLQQLELAQQQFDEMLALAQTGDIGALNALPGLAQTLLGFGQDVFASSSDYVDIFDYVTSSLSALGVTSSPADPQQTIIGQNSQMIELLARRNELEEQFDAQAHMEAVMAVAEQIREWASVSEESFASLADRLGIPVEAFLADLGVSLDELTVETTLALAETANLLGIEITDLAESVGASLGALADDQSLLNDALEATIAQLPSGIASDLDAMLTAIEQSTDAGTREELLNSMVEFIQTLPADQSELLAPYFEQIDPITEAQQQVTEMQSLNASNVSILEQIINLVDQQRTAELNDGERNEAVVSAFNNMASEISRVLDLVGTGG